MHRLVGRSPSLTSFFTLAARASDGSKRAGRISRLMRSPLTLLLFAVLFAGGAACSEPNGEHHAKPTPVPAEAPAATADTAASAETPAPAEASSDEADDGDLDVDAVPWSTAPSIVGAGIAYKDTQRASDQGVAVLYAGFHVDLAGAEAWASALYRATLRDRGVRHIFAVQGPATPNYAGREIGN